MFSTVDFRLSEVGGGDLTYRVRMGTLRQMYNSYKSPKMPHESITDS